MDPDKLIKDFIAYLKTRGRSEPTIIAYKKDIEQLFDHIKATLPQFAIKPVTPEFLQTYLDSLQLSGKFTLKTISRKINSLKTFFRFLFAKNLITANPSENIKHPKFDIRPPRILSSLEYRAIRDTARSNVRIFAMVELLLQTGMRIGELSRLLRRDVTLTGDKKTVHIIEFSSNPARDVELNETVAAALKQYLDNVNPVSQNPDKNYLFYTRSGRPVLIRNIRTAIDRIFKKAGVKNATVNDIRNTFIVYQLENGMKLDRVAEVVGHRKSTTTEKYQAFVTQKATKSTDKIVPL